MSRLNWQRPGHDVDRASRHLQHAHRRHQVRRGRGAALCVERQLGHRGGGVAPAVHRRRAGMAGHADHFADMAHAAVDRGHDAERQVEFVEHRPLLDVRLDEAEVVGRVALRRRDRLQRAGQAGGMHGVLHAHAVGIALRQPGGVELADDRARAEEGRLVALALLFGEADHLDAEGQAPPGAMQFAHAGHRHEDAESAVVLAAVAHRVVVRAGEQPAAAQRQADRTVTRTLRSAPLDRGGPAAGHGHRVVDAPVHADHVADRVDVRIVEAALLHPLLKAARAGLVRLRQVGHGELAVLPVAGVALGGERFGPVPHQVAEFGRRAELVVQADLGDAMDVAQALGELEVRMAFQAPREGLDDLLPRQPRPRGPRTARTNGKPNLSL